MAVNAGLTISQVTLDSLTWTAITAPYDCNGFAIQDQAGTAAIKVRSDKDDMTTEMTINAGMQGKILTNPPYTSAGDSSVVNFKKNQRVGYFQSGTGTITAVCQFL